MRTVGRHIATSWSVLSCLLLASASAHAHNWSAASCNGNCSSCTPCTPQLTPSNGFPQHPEIAALFWESAAGEWTNGTNVAHTRSQEMGMLLSLVNNGQFWSEIAPMHIAPPRLAPYASIFTGNVNGHNPAVKTANFTKTDIEALINNAITNGTLPQPQPNDNMIYAVFVPSDGNSAGCGDCNFTIPLPNSKNIPNFQQDANANFNGVPYTAVFSAGTYAGMSHELVESIATYEGINVTNACGGTGGTQIEDTCDCATEVVNSIPVGAYFSATKGECVVPEAWGGVWEDPNELGWLETSGAFPVRQASGGAGGVVATNQTEASNGTGNAVSFYNGSSWTQFGGGGAQFAAGGGIIAGIGFDAQNLNYFDIATGSWSGAGAPPNVQGAKGTPLVTGVTVTANGIIVATDQLANPWYFDPSNPGWHHIAGPGDQFIAGGGAGTNAVWALSPSHNGLYFWSGPGSGFDFVSSVSPTTQVVASPDSTFVAISVAGKAEYTFASTTISATLQGGVTNVAGGPLFEFQDRSVNDDVFICGSLNCNGSGSPQNSLGFGGWLISGAAPFVTGCDSGSAPCVTLTAEAPWAQPKFF
jgi:hypothetical protein